MSRRTGEIAETLTGPSASLESFRMLIGGQWTDAASGKTSNSLNPYTHDEVVALLPNAQEPSGLAIR